MKRFIGFMLVVLFVFGLASCGKCEHKWSDATCVSAKKCILCGKTEGNVLEHKWQEATCTQSQICLLCNMTEGNPKEHVLTAGICEICEEDLLSVVERKTLVENEFLEVDSEINLSLMYINNISSNNPGNVSKMYDSIISREDNFKNSFQALNDALILCEPNSRFSGVEKAINTAINSYPQMPINEVSSIQSFLDDLEIYLVNIASAKLQLVYVA